MKKVLSKLSRRSFFGAAAAAAAAGPLAVDAVAKDIEGRTFAWSGAVHGGTGMGPSTGQGGLLSRIDSLKEQIAKIKVKPVPLCEVSRLDADLVANRSLALHVRIRIQSERDAERRAEYQRRWRLDEIDDLLGL